jgi:hypothetical protein
MTQVSDVTPGPLVFAWCDLSHCASGLTIDIRCNYVMVIIKINALTSTFH